MIYQKNINLKKEYELLEIQAIITYFVWNV
jgi:hypothetical protein